jgi:DNA-binding PadR family transcriptional regulator
MQSTRAYLINAIGIKGTPTFRDISMFLINNEKIMFVSPAAHQNYLKHGSKVGHYYHSTEIMQNLETLQDCGLIEIISGTNRTNYAYQLTPEGQQLYTYIASQTQNGDLGLCPKCGTNMFNLYGALLSDKLPDAEKFAEEEKEEIMIKDKNIEIYGRLQTNVNNRNYFKLTVYYTCKHCNHKWQEEDLT